MSSEPNRAAADSREPCRVYVRHAPRLTLCRDVRSSRALSVVADIAHR